MNRTKLTTLAAGLMTCVCFGGLSESANAQYFSNGNDRPVPGNRTYSQPSELFRPIASQQLQWQDQMRSRNDRYLRTNVGGPTPDGYNGSSGSRCPGGQCQHRSYDGVQPTDSLTYRGQQSNPGDYRSRRFQSRSALTTGWDPSRSTVDPITGQPSERSRRHIHTESEGPHGHCRGGACHQGECDCPEGQCDCPVGARHNHDSQSRYRGLDQQQSPTSYDRFNLTRRNNLTPQYLPTRSLRN